MLPISSRTRSRIRHGSDGGQLTITLRSSIRGLEGLVISIPTAELLLEDNDDVSDLTYVETEGTDESEEEETSRHVQPEKLNKFVVNRANRPVDVCPICLEGFTCRQHFRKLACLHTFHVRCIDRWLVKVPDCPVCRCRVQPQQSMPRSLRILRSASDG